MIEIKGVNDIGRGRFIIHYIKPSVCLCSFVRGSLVVTKKKKPSETEAKKLIEDDLKNKG